MNGEVCKQTGFTAAGLFIGIGLIVLGFLLKAAVNDFKASERIVSVKGLSEHEYPADKVILPIQFKEIGNDLPTLYAALEQKTAAVNKFLKSNGVDENEISLSAPEIIDMQAERWQTNQVPVRYNATMVVTVTSNKVDLVREIITRQADLLKEGVAITSGDYRYNTIYLFTKLNDVKPQMIEEATKNARQSAEKFAHDSDSDLGKIKSATQGQFSIMDRDANTPHIKTVRVVTNIEYYLKD